MKKVELSKFMVGVIIAFAVAAISVKLFFSTLIVGQSDSNLIVSAAASLKTSLEEIQTAYRQVIPSFTLKYNFGSSGALQQQIENGAPVDIFISAAQKQMDELQSKGLILSETRSNLLTNQLVLIVPRSSAISSFQQLTSLSVKRIAIGEPRSVPAGQYAQEVLKNLGILEEVRPKFVLGNNVRQVLAAVENSNADAGIVYVTDAINSQLVKQVTTAPENLHAPIIYPVAVIKSSRNVAAAKKYLQFLGSDRARSIFRRYGFGIAQ